MESFSVNVVRSLVEAKFLQVFDHLFLQNGDVVPKKVCVFIWRFKRERVPELFFMIKVWIFISSFVLW